jgi:ribonuclease Y
MTREAAMPEFVLPLIVAVAGLVIGALAVTILSRRSAQGTIRRARAEEERIRSEAGEAADKIRRTAELEAKELLLSERNDFERETRDKRAELARLEERLNKKQENLDRKNDLVNSKEVELSRRQSTLEKKDQGLDRRRAEIDSIVAEQTKKLEQVASLTREQAREQVMATVVEDAKRAAARSVKQIEDDAKTDGEKRAKNVIATSIMRFASDFVQERSVSVVHLPGDEMKGRIIGREGRNIRALEAATGMDFIVDDTPETVIISGFDPVRREVARLALEKLISDGRIHPNRIEEIVKKCEDDVQKTVREAGEQAVLELGIGRLNPELVKLVGQLRYRYSYAQNVLQHSVEAAFLCGLMAAELGESVKKARRAALLHDIGKAVSHEVEGSHAVSGAQLATKFGETPEIVNAIGAHHEDEPPQSILAFLVAAADAISGARPGARREILETYLKRIEDLERLCSSFDGVDKSYAIQAGREVRVLVKSEKLSDDDTAVLAHDIASRIEKDLTYPGQIKVTVIRETRSVEFAR